MSLLISYNPGNCIEILSGRDIAPDLFCSVLINIDRTSRIEEGRALFSGSGLIIWPPFGKNII